MVVVGVEVIHVGVLDVVAAIENPVADVESSSNEPFDEVRMLPMKIGALAEATGISIETIRFYEREGLLPPPARGENNYRMYLPVHVERLAFIRQCRNLDMALDEVRALIGLRENADADCGGINALLDEHIGHVAQRIRELCALEKELKGLRARCASPHAVADCGILGELDRAAAPSSRKGQRRHIHGAH